MFPDVNWSFDDDSNDSDWESGYNKMMPYAQYAIVCDTLIDKLAAVYNPQKPAGGHDSELAKQLSAEITDFVRTNWDDAFYAYQRPKT